MTDILTYAWERPLHDRLEEAFKELGLSVESCASLADLPARAGALEPKVIVLCLGKRDVAGDLVARLRRVCPETKIVYGTKSPGKEDLVAIQQSVFYYAGDAEPEAILSAAKAALGRLAAGHTRLVRYQLRLRPGETLEDVLRQLRLAVAERLAAAGWGPLGPEEEAALERELRACLDYYAAAYDLCGLKATCFETAVAVEWGGPPDAQLDEPREWEGVRVLQLELREGLGEFLMSLEAAVFRAVCRDAGRAALAKPALRGLEEALKRTLAHRLYRAGEFECDLCLVVRKVNPWTLAEEAL